VSRLGYVDISSPDDPYRYYGNNFMLISNNEFNRRIKLLGERTDSNFIAMAALGYKSGFYTSS